ncbi:hypothetical protein AVEN_48607-1 [Araneus ventricosus]|uniref:Uncharacterized protein n=1 Tax=Araneus ventricosus TaxID=182803 RepID=A0A4Y2M612_ARAVE|nr:hypothetical protein AVEN_48607-1 [Araneus ventricosus]
MAKLHDSTRRVQDARQRTTTQDKYTEEEERREDHGNLMALVAPPTRKGEGSKCNRYTTSGPKLDKLVVHSVRQIQWSNSRQPQCPVKTTSGRTQRTSGPPRQTSYPPRQPVGNLDNQWVQPVVHPGQPVVQSRQTSYPPQGNQWSILVSCPITAT